LQVSVVTAALVAGAWMPARADVDDGEVIIIDGCAPNKVEWGGECVLIEKVLQFRRSTGDEPTLGCGLLIHIGGGAPGGGGGSAPPTADSCLEAFSACTDDSEDVFWHCASVTGLTREAERYCLRGHPPFSPVFRGCVERRVQAKDRVCRKDREADVKECDRFYSACMHRARR
jgi:hypothetical protein